MRLIIAINKFWPFCESSQLEAADLAAALNRQGNRAEVVTVRWRKHWPTHLSFREMKVTRLNRPAKFWGACRFLREFSRLVNQDCPDAMIVYGLSHESWLAIRHFAHQLPVLVRLSGHDLSIDQRHFRHRQLAALKSVQHFVVDSPETGRSSEKSDRRFA